MAARPDGRIRWNGGDPDRLALRTKEDALVWLGALDDAARAMAAVAPTPSDRHDADLLAESARPGFLRRRALMRCCVARWLGEPVEGVVLAYDAHRRPRLLSPGGALFVSGASRAGWHAVALAAAPVGVDVEPLLGTGEPAWAALAAGERRRLAALPDAERATAFLVLWTAKEATLKALGIGLAREPDTIAIEPGAAGRFTVAAGGRPLPLRAAQSRAVAVGAATLRAACVVLG